MFHLRDNPKFCKVVFKFIILRFMLQHYSSSNMDTVCKLVLK